MGMTDYDFNDIEDADVYDADPTLDPTQVGIRLHELRTRIEELVGSTGSEYWELSESEQALVNAIGKTIVQHFTDHPAGSAEETARTIHNVRRFFAALAGDSVPNWDDLGDDHRDLAVAIATEIIEWIKREGPR